MFYVPLPDKVRRSFYIGIEAEVAVAEALRWCRDIESISG
jgi:hypothetical protein